MAKYGRVAEQSNLRFVPAVFSHTGQVHGEYRAFVKEQITQKLLAFEGEAKPSKIRSVMETNTWAQLEDVGQNADLYIANQGAYSQP